MRVSYLGQASGASTALASFTAPEKLVKKIRPENPLELVAKSS